MKRKTSKCTLPEELVIDILLRLPVKTLVRSKCICKSWRDLIASRDFVKLDLNRSLEQNSGIILLHSCKYSFLGSYDFNHPRRPAVELHYPDMVKLGELCDHREIVGICNGVVCFEKAGVLVFYNPTTRECKQVLKPITHTRPEYILHLEFAYDCISDDYKVVCITEYYRSKLDPRRETHVYSLKANSWRKITIPCFGYKASRTPSVVANNSLYWVCRVDDMEMSEVIQRFDLSSETSEEMSFEIEDKTRRVHRLVVLRGRLHTMTYRNGINIWMLNEDNRWVRIFQTSIPPYFKSKVSLVTTVWPLPCACSKDGHKILVEFEGAKKGFICCDLETQTISRVQILGLPEDDAKYISIPWVESLVPLG